MKKVVLLSLFCLVFFAFSTEAKVCELSAKCAIPSLPNAINNSKAIFAGRVINVEKDGDMKVFTLQVNRYWKGSIKRLTKIYVFEAMRYQAWYELGKSYLVYANINEEGKLIDGRCSASKRIEDAKEDLKLLKKGKRPK